MPLRAGLWTAAAVLLLALVVSRFAGAPVQAQDQDQNTGLRAYLAIPFNGSTGKPVSRVGVQLLTTWNEDESALNRAFVPPRLDTAVDFAVSRRGLAKFEVMGADARGAWNAAAQWLGMEVNVPEECETTYRCQRERLLLAADPAPAGVQSEATASFAAGAMAGSRLP